VSQSPYCAPIRGPVPTPIDRRPGQPLQQCRRARLRDIADGWRNWTFAGSGRGGKRVATVIETARLNDVDRQAWPADVLRRVNDHPAGRQHELLPWNWRAAAEPAVAA
jgi:hypothetical protein